MSLRDHEAQAYQENAKVGLNQAVPSGYTGNHRDTYQRKTEECYNKARARGQRTFTLVEQDLTAPRLIVEWIKENIETAPSGKLHDALAHAIAMRDYPSRKAAD